MDLVIQKAKLDGRTLTDRTISQLDLVKPGDLTPVVRYRPKKGDPAAVYVLGVQPATGATVRSFAFAEDRPHLMMPLRDAWAISAEHHAAFALLDLVIV